MRKPRKRSFSELVNENKRQLLSDQAAIQKIEDRLEKNMLLKHSKKETTFPINET